MMKLIVDLHIILSISFYIRAAWHVVYWMSTSAPTAILVLVRVKFYFILSNIVLEKCDTDITELWYELNDRVCYTCFQCIFG